MRKSTMAKKAAKAAKRARRNRNYNRVRSRARQTRNRSMVPVGLGFPKKLVMTHKYVDYTTLTGTAGAMANYAYSCNSMYDPNTTGGGHQPLYFDQLSAIYDHWTVIGSKITFRITPLSTNAITANIGIWVDDNASVTGSAMEAVAEQSQAKLRVLPLATACAGPIVVTQKWSAKKWFGGSILGNPNLQGISSASPGEQSYYLISIQSHDQTATVAAYVIVEIEYIAVWAELKDVATS